MAAPDPSWVAPSQNIYRFKWTLVLATGDSPPAMLMKSSPVALYTSMYLLPMWCLCRLSAMSLWATLSSSTRASPLRRPCGDRHSATPENICYTKNISEQYKASPPGATLRPVKNLATSVSLACQGSPRARTTQLPSTWIAIEFEHFLPFKGERNGRDVWFRDRHFMNLNFENCQKQLVFTQPRTILLRSRLRWPRNSFAHGCGLQTLHILYNVHFSQKLTCSLRDRIPGSRDICITSGSWSFFPSLNIFCRILAMLLTVLRAIS